MNELTSDLGSAFPTRIQNQKHDKNCWNWPWTSCWAERIRLQNFIGYAVIFIESLHTEELQDGAGYIWSPGRYQYIWSYSHFYFSNMLVGFKTTLSSNSAVILSYLGGEIMSLWYDKAIIIDAWQLASYYFVERIFIIFHGFFRFACGNALFFPWFGNSLRINNCHLS